MGQHSQLLADRYHLQLDSSWQGWFDHAYREFALPGFFRQPVDVVGLCDPRPTQIWAGFMLPDTLPVLGNGYGDWLCMRIDESNRPSEMVHWYHGGGDWIPVGRSLSEAIVHDAVDVHRPVRKQMLRGAVETARVNNNNGIDSLSKWLMQAIAPSRSDLTEDDFSGVMRAARDREYSIALESLSRKQLALEAVHCDCIEQIIHQAVPSENASLNMLSEQDWEKIQVHCREIINVRQDLGWSFSLLGWSQQQLGDSEAAESFYRGRLASAFSDQSVRLRLHRFEQRYGKFSIAQLSSGRFELSDSMREDEYLSIFLSGRDSNLVAKVQDYWLAAARKFLDLGNYSQAYHCAYNAGWDLGATNMASYRKILELLNRIATEAGWLARAAIAKAHIDAI